MAAPVYATPADLAAWTGEAAPPNATRLLRSAALLVRRDTAADYYDADTVTGLPTDTTLATAMQEATCAQVAMWAANSIDPAGGAAGVDAVVSQRAQGGRSESYALGVDADRINRAQITTLCPESAAILRQAGLASAGVWAA